MINDNFLKNLYIARVAFQVIWAITLMQFGTGQPNLGGILLIVYPLWDVVCSIVELKYSWDANLVSNNKSHILNIGVGISVAIVMALTGLRDSQNMVVSFGGWAIISGLLQLTAGIARRKAFKGQWAMILSGAQSAVAGTAFILGGLSGNIHPTRLAGYALFGALYFMIATVLLIRKKALNPSQ